MHPTGGPRSRTLFTADQRRACGGPVQAPQAPHVARQNVPEPSLGSHQACAEVPVASARGLPSFVSEHSRHSVRFFVGADWPGRWCGLTGQPAGAGWTDRRSALQRGRVERNAARPCTAQRPLIGVPSPLSTSPPNPSERLGPPLCLGALFAALRGPFASQACGDIGDYDVVVLAHLRHGLFGRMVGALKHCQFEAVSGDYLRMRAVNWCGPAGLLRPRRWPPRRHSDRNARGGRTPQWPLASGELRRAALSCLSVCLFVLFVCFVLLFSLFVCLFGGAVDFVLGMRMRPRH